MFCTASDWCRTFEHPRWKGKGTCLVCSLSMDSSSFMRCALIAWYFSCSAAYSSCRPLKS